MKLLITGGCGFVGSNLAAHALERGDELALFDNLQRQGSAENLHWLQGRGNFRFFTCDIRNREEVDQLIRLFSPDGIFHLAGQVAMTSSIANPRLDFETNALGTLNLLEAVREKRPEAAVIFSSTNKVYGDLLRFRYLERGTRYECPDRPEGFDEETPLDFQTPYGCSKGSADQYMLDYARSYGLRTVVFRHSSMYGGRQFSTCDQGWIGWFCQQALAAKLGTTKEPFTISGNGKQVRDLLHADDMVSLYFTALDRMDVVRGQAFNVGGGMSNSLSLLELFTTLEELLKVKLNYRSLPLRLNDQLVFVADLGKVRRLLGWEPKVAREEGIGRMLEWVEHGR